MNDNLKINTLIKNNIVCFYLIGQLDAHSAPRLEEEIEKYIINSNKQFVFNLSNLEYISSAGLGVFMSFIQELRENNGDIKFAELNDRVKNVMELLGFNQIYDITNSEQEAIEKYSN